MTVGIALGQGVKLLEDASVPGARLTAEVLLSHAIGCERVWLVAHSDEELREVWWIHYGRYLHERIRGKPTQYITGHQEFYGRDFRISPDVLIPRPETEHVVEAVLQRAHRSQRIIDIGTGSGAIAITLALELPTRVFATDLSEAALRVAIANGKRLGAVVDWMLCDLATPLATAAFDMVVSNPPYVPKRTASQLPREVRDFEPALALFGGEDGCDVYNRLIPEARRVLRPGGTLILELGSESAERVRQLLADWHELEIRPDLAGIPRVALARKAP